MPIGDAWRCKRTLENGQVCGGKRPRTAKANVSAEMQPLHFASCDKCGRFGEELLRDLCAADTESCVFEAIQQTWHQKTTHGEW